MSPPAAFSEYSSATLLATQPYECPTESSSHSYDIPPGAALNRASVQDTSTAKGTRGGEIEEGVGDTATLTALCCTRRL